VTAARVHHSAIAVRDVASSLRFYRDGIGLDVLMDHVFEGDWPTLFDAPSTTLRSIFLGDSGHPGAGIVELVVFDPPAPVSAPMPASPTPASPTPASPTPAGAVAAPGFFLLSFYVDIDQTLGRLDALGFGPARRVEQPAPTGTVSMACIYDPDGVRVELVGVVRTPG
jgi:catechol 2,3-dioxygenase-like lactoylglutathione lyase family enzyme